MRRPTRVFSHSYRWSEKKEILAGMLIYPASYCCETAFLLGNVFVLHWQPAHIYFSTFAEIAWLHPMFLLLPTKRPRLEIGRGKKTQPPLLEQL